MKKMKNNKMVFIADNDDSNRNAIKDSLEKAGFFVLSARDHTESVQKINSNNFDAAIIELMTPDGKGFELVSIVREKYRDIPVIGISNEDSIEIERTARERGVTSYFSKPVEIEQLKTMISRLIK